MSRKVVRENLKPKWNLHPKTFKKYILDFTRGTSEGEVISPLLMKFIPPKLIRRARLVL